MWVITNFGFFSVVEKPADEKDRTLTVRARVKADLENLRDEYISDLGPIIEDAGTDYKFRAKVPRLDLASALSQIVLDIDYSNFKSSVAKIQGVERSKLYHKLWDVLYRLQSQDATKTTSVNEKRMSYGGVLFNERHVLLRRPKGDYDGYVWTFPKGKGEPNSTAEETALREVKEETGYNAEIVAKIPGQFKGGTGATEYFLMRPLGEPTAFDPSETEATAWVSLDEAPEHISQTRNEIGKRRDQDVLEAAIRYLDEHATALSFNTFEMPAKKARLTFQMRFSAGEFARLKRGFIPDGMDDHWFVFFEKDWLNCHRSWTGFCIYRLRLQPDGECYRVAETWVNRDPEQYGETSQAKAKKELMGLLHYAFGIGDESSAW